MAISSKTTSIKDILQTVFRSPESVLLPGEVAAERSTGPRYSIEDTVELYIHAKAASTPELDIATLPPVLEFAEGYRPGIVVFATSAKPGVMVTNLPVQAVAPQHIAMCSNVAEVALLALSLSEGFSLKYLGSGGSRSRLSKLGQEFANEFLRSIADAAESGRTVIHEIADVRQWLAQQVWWKRSTESAPGTEFA
jgi:hypothetical protein